MVSPGPTTVSASLRQTVVPATPSRVTPRPAWASAAAKALARAPRRLRISRMLAPISQPATAKAPAAGKAARAGNGQHHDSRDRGQSQRRIERAPDGFQIAAPPAQLRPERHQQQQREKDRREGQRIIRRTDGNLGAVHGVQHQRIERADKNAGAGGDQKDIVEQQAWSRGLPARRPRRLEGWARARRTAPAPRRSPARSAP